MHSFAPLPCDIEGVPSSPVVFSLAGDGSSQRLDAALAFAFPGLGLRGRRRLWRWCRVSVNGRQRSPGFMVSPGDEIRVEAFRAPEPVSEEYGADPRLLHMDGDFALLDKPAGLHTAHIAGGRLPSLETLLPVIWEKLFADWQATGGAQTGGPSVPAPVRLLTRLDRVTSGLVLAALNEAAAARFRKAEAEGLVRKSYLAVVQGGMRHPLHVSARLLTDERSKTLALHEADTDPARHTEASPLCAVQVEGDALCLCSGDGDGTLVRVDIRRGARHQIRAHLASAGYPLFGDELYAESSPQGKIFLHHARLELPGLAVTCLPDWARPFAGRLGDLSLPGGPGQA